MKNNTKKILTEKNETIYAAKIMNNHVPDNTTILVDKLTYHLSMGLTPYGERTALKMERRGSKNKITTFITLDIKKSKGDLPENIGATEINVLEAIISLLEENNVDDNKLANNYYYYIKNNKI